MQIEANTIALVLGLVVHAGVVGYFLGTIRTSLREVIRDVDLIHTEMTDGTIFRHCPKWGGD
jgi:hypothetical protein